MLSPPARANWRSLDRRTILRSACGALAFAVGMQGAGPAKAAEEPARFFRIGTGPTSGNYFAIGSTIANAISSPPGSRPCNQGGSCGVSGLIATAETTRGSVENVGLITERSIESALCQSDVAFWAYSGTGMYRGETRLDGLRAIANLYQESLHIVVRSDAKIGGIADLRGKRISLGERGAGTRATATTVLAAYGLGSKSYQGQQLPIAKAAEQLKDRKIDGIFLVGGPPVPALAELAQTTALKLLPVEGEQAYALRANSPFLTVDIIPENSYGEQPALITLGVGTYWLVLAELEEPLVHDIAAALWHKSSRKLLDQSGAIGRRIRLEQALDGLPIPLHPGAERYYAEARNDGGTP